MPTKTENKNIKQDQVANEAFSYDEFPYESYPFGYTRPEHFNTIGKLFGMNPPPIETARILELGCSNGGNIINFAEIYPKSYSLGVDLSKVEIDAGNNMIKEIGLNNIELKHMSITDIDESFGKFDYIICHGVFSWVPDFVKEKILEISKTLLNPNGISFVSYNTLPGWNMINSIRDMMLFHSGIFENTFDKLHQAKLFLGFINESLEGSNSPYANFLKGEAVNLAKQEDQYLRHEYLAEENKQFYFHEFMKMAGSRGLSYLGDANLSSMFLGNLPKKAAEQLQTINDIVRTEQYMDFIQNKRFRCTMLTHTEVQFNRNITYEILRGFYTSCMIAPEKLESAIDINNAMESIKFYFNNSLELSVSTSSPIMKAIFYTYIDNVGNPLATDELLKLAAKKLTKVELKDVEAEFAGVIAKLVFSSYLKIFAIKPGAINEISAKPKVSKLVRYQVKHLKPNKLWVTNQMNEIIILHHHERFIIELLDGKHSHDQLKQDILKRLTDGEIVANEGEIKITDPAALEAIAVQCVTSALERFRTNYILIG